MDEDKFGGEVEEVIKVFADSMLEALRDRDYGAAHALAAVWALLNSVLDEFLPTNVGGIELLVFDTMIINLHKTLYKIEARKLAMQYALVRKQEELPPI